MELFILSLEYPRADETVALHLCVQLSLTEFALVRCADVL